MIGIVFSAALAVGSMITSGEELIDALFGTSSALSKSELIFGLVGAVAVIVFIITQRDSLIVMIVSPEVARTAGINVGWLNLLYLEAFALTIALGLRFLGVLLMGALIIVPAATAKGLARNLTGMLCMAAGIAVLATVVGTWAGVSLHRASGPLIVLTATSVFLLSLARKPA
jgi:ABC-type Mn2+/Zn2+ transport system permease subunit